MKNFDTVLGVLNDFWAYSIATGWWTWIGGDRRVNQAGRYGTMGIAAATNIPGGRDSHSMVIDMVNNSIVVFGGDAGTLFGMI